MITEEESDKIKDLLAEVESIVTQSDVGRELFDEIVDVIDRETDTYDEESITTHYGEFSVLGCKVVVGMFPFKIPITIRIGPVFIKLGRSRK